MCDIYKFSDGEHASGVVTLYGLTFFYYFSCLDHANNKPEMVPILQNACLVLIHLVE